MQKSKLRKQSLQWMTKTIRVCGGEKKTNKQKKTMRSIKDQKGQSNKAEYCNMRAKVKNELRLAKKLFERHISEVAKCNPKHFFLHCSRKIKAKEEVKCIKNTKVELLQCQLRSFLVIVTHGGVPTL